MEYFAIALCIISGIIICINLTIPFRFLLARGQSKGNSLIPIIGGALGALGLFIYPNAKVNDFAWIPLFADLGCVPAIIGALLRVLFDRDQ